MLYPTISGAWTNQNDNMSKAWHNDDKEGTVIVLSLT